MGEVIDLVKKNGGVNAASDPELRMHLVEEMADVLLAIDKKIEANTATNPDLHHNWEDRTYGFLPDMIVYNFIFLLNILVKYFYIRAV